MKVPWFGVFLLAGLQAGTIVNTGNVDGRMAMASRPGSSGVTEIEAADDFLLNTGGALTMINSGAFTGLITGSTPSIQDVVVEIYRIFPVESTNPPSGNVPTRVNSPSDIAFLSLDAALGDFSFSTTTQNVNFTASNSVLNGINKVPNQTTGGEGAVTGTEILFNFTFTNPFALGDGHYFFIPMVQVSGGQFYWLSTARPIVAPGTPFTGDLQTWIRNANLDPDWLRVGTDIVGGTTPPTFNGAFSLDGTAVPEPSSLGLCLAALGALGWRVFRRERLN